MPTSENLNGDRTKTKGYDVVLTENTDDFIIGDRVWVNGTKPGYIQYLGETRFGPGEWAGVVLDDHSGKNDGSVAGVHYFQCEPKRGVFSRLHKLTRFPLTSGTSSPVSGRTASPIGSNGGRSGSSSPLLRCSTPTRAPSPGSRPARIGDRVVVNASGGIKLGVLRYLGTTDFAPGEWAGVELDEPTGKNNGHVAGKRYFDCGPKYGLFAPVHRVNKATGSAASQRKYHDSSHDSLSNCFSSKESLDQSEMKLEEENEDERPTSLPKLRERSDSKQVQDQLDQLQGEHSSYVEDSERRTNRLKQLLEAAESERKSLRSQLQEEKRKVEDLEFRVDEECISKDDLEAEREKERTQIEELEAKLQQEIEKNQLLSEGQTLDSATSEMIKTSREETRKLREQLREAKNQIQTLTNQPERRRSPTSSRSVEAELTRKEENLLQMQVTLDNKKRELQSLHSRVADMEKDVEKYKSRQEKHLQTIDSLNVKLQKIEYDKITLNDELHLKNQNLEDAERLLLVSEEKCREVEKEKFTLRDQMDRSLPHDDLMTELNNQLKEKERQLMESEKRLSKNVLSEQDLREENQKTRSLSSRHQEEIIDLNAKIERLREDVARERDTRSSLEDELQREKERRKSLVSSTELDFVKERLDDTREQLRRLQIEKDRFRSEREDARRRLELAQERVKQAEEDREAHVTMLKSEVQRLRSEFTGYREDLVKKLAETQYDTRLAQELQDQNESQRRMLEDVQMRLKQSQAERTELQNILMDTKTSLLEKQQALESLNTSLQEEIVSLTKRQKELMEDFEALQRSLEASQILAEHKQQQIDTYYSELNNLRAKLSDQKEEIARGSAKQLENKVVELQVELAKIKNGQSSPDSNRRAHKTEKEGLENQVEFLQSVIVDMQKKNDDLRSRLEILETEVIFDAQPHLSDNTSLTLRDLIGLPGSTFNTRPTLSATPSVCEDSEMF